MKLLLLFLAVVAVSWAAEPCSAPSELTMRAARHDFGDTYFSRYYSEYDRNNQRIVMFEESFSGSIRELREFLFIHTMAEGFEFDFRTKICKKFPLGPFRPFEVPANSTFEGEYEIGGPDERVVIDRWSDKIPTRRETWIGEFSLGNCYPVNTFLLEELNFNRTAITHFYDVVEGVVNPADFDVPTECQQAPLMKEMPYRARSARSVFSRSMYL